MVVFSHVYFIHPLGPPRVAFAGFYEIYGTHLNPENMEAGKEVQKGLPTLVYYSRKDAGTPKISPKAGNM